MKDLIQIKIAETDAEREAAYRLRYEVFGLEEGDHRYSDHERKFWIDQDDGPNSTVLVALNQEGRCVGTTRFTMLRDQHFIALDAYHFDVLAPRFNLSLSQLTEVIGRWDRGAVERQCRGGGLFQRLEEELVACARLQGCQIIVVVVETGNAAMLHIVQKAGYLSTSVVGHYQGFTGYVICKDLREYQPEID